MRAGEAMREFEKFLRAYGHVILPWAAIIGGIGAALLIVWLLRVLG